MSKNQNNDSNESAKFHFGRNLMSVIIVVFSAAALILLILTITGAINHFKANKVTPFVDGEPNYTYSSTDYTGKMFDDIEYINSENDYFSYEFTCTDWDTTNEEYDSVDFQLKTTWKFDAYDSTSKKPYLSISSNIETSFLVEICIASNVGCYTSYSSIKKGKVNMNVNSGTVTTTISDMQIEKFPKSAYTFPFFYTKELPTVYVDIFFFTDQQCSEYVNYGLKYEYKDLGISSGGISA